MQLFLVDLRRSKNIHEEIKRIGTMALKIVHCGGASGALFSSLIDANMKLSRVGMKNLKQKDVRIE